MLTIGSAFSQLRNMLLPLYDEREAAAIAHGIMEHLTGMGRAHRLVHKEQVLTPAQLERFEHALGLAVAGTPMQYITGRAWFMGGEYLVNSSVLIPRPETAELVDWIIATERSRGGQLRVLDVGTGSGCIPISLSKGLPGAVITSCDISQAALAVAQQNAAAMNAGITLLHLDFLDRRLQAELGMFDIIVSNPPYIPVSEKENLHVNVRNHEPATALFVPDNDALVFYRELALFGHSHLAGGGAIYCELDAGHARETVALFEGHGYSNVSLRKDMHGNYRMLMAQK